ncbi:hypothetical protein SynMEDNS5_01841 [Synechococcus sp. MEDNS5]|uniref:hypothetical protein n=1 Tax=Synechococcus sp. MEDNS5 TaxID=1442554 RepID=UPI000B6B125B|nr:hypothetical protein [Synechococcus sp. MEDNS5]OUX70878.1 MAG: hypothetical protein CBC50_08720 [Synechococcus sp. TMED90]QNJ06555.1 hypothetical protein SynMEDNS5_01841 [Synechococcus sp. MEDNS5]
MTGIDSRQPSRRQRLHELLLALIAREDDLELMDGEGPAGLAGSATGEGAVVAARWLERNQRVFQKYQALVRTAVTLDALLDDEQRSDSSEA